LIGLVEAAQQACFSRTSIAQNQHLGLVKMINALQIDFAQIVQNSFLALLNDFRGGGWISGQL
jgi:hypothetical protein